MYVRVPSQGVEFYLESQKIHQTEISLSKLDQGIAQGSKAILGKSSQENKILTDCSTRLFPDCAGKGGSPSENGPHLCLWASLQ